LQAYVAKAKRSDPSSLSKLGTVATSLLRPPDIQAVAGVCLHLVAQDLERLADGPLELWRISQASLTFRAIESFKSVARRTRVTDKYHLYSSWMAPLESGDNWKKLLQWASVIILQGIEDPDKNYEDLDRVDRLFAEFALSFSNTGTLMMQWREHVAFWSSLSRLWFSQTAKCLGSVALPRAIVCNAFKTSRWMAIFGGSERELIRACLDRIMYFRSQEDVTEHLFAIKLLDALVWNLSSDTIQYIILEGGIPVLVQSMTSLVEQSWKDVPRRDQPDRTQTALTVVLELATLLYKTMAFGPSYICQAVDAGLIRTILRASIYFTDWHRAESTQSKSELGDCNDRLLSMLQSNMYHPRLSAHI
jgi:hypothetical protein